MKPKLLLTIAAIYMGLVGLFDLILPAAAFGLDAGATAVLIGSVRVISSLYLGIAVLNWFARDAEASQARNAIFLANTVAAGLWAILFVPVVLDPNVPALGWVFVAINLIYAVAFFLVGRANMSSAAA